MTPAAPVRCFVALYPPPVVVEDLRALRDDGVPGVRWASAEQLHVTLRFLGDVAPDEAALAVARVRHGAVDVRLGPAATRMFGTVFAVPVSGVDGLAGEVRRRTERLVPDDGRPFIGHLTLGRLRRGGGRPGAVPVELAWRAERLALVSSRPVDGRHRHEVLAEVALGS